MNDPRLAKLAHLLVTYSAEIKPGQLVRISGSTVAEPLVIELYRQLISIGAHPFVQLNPDELSEIMYKEGSEDQLKYISPVTRTLIEKIER